jgi:hypothetical protein
VVRFLNRGEGCAKAGAFTSTVFFWGTFFVGFLAGFSRRCGAGFCCRGRFALHQPPALEDDDRTVAQLDDASIRRFGLGCMLFGIAMLYLVN